MLLEIEVMLLALKALLLAAEVMLLSAEGLPLHAEVMLLQLEAWALKQQGTRGGQSVFIVLSHQRNRLCPLPLLA